MKIHLLALPIVAFGLACPRASAADFLIDFEGLPGMPNGLGYSIPTASQLSSQFLASKGILFSSASPFVAIVHLGSGHATSGSIGIGGSSALGELEYSGITRFTFFDTANTSVQAATDLFRVRGDLIPDGLTATLNAYDVLGNLVDFDTQVDVGGNTFTVSTAQKVIHRVEFVGTGSIALDDVEFNAATPVPEPATLILGGLGLAVACRRRRRAA